MKSLINILTLFAFVGGSQSALASTPAIVGQLNAKAYELPNTLRQKDNQEIFARYCTGEADSSDPTTANTSNALVQKTITALQNSVVQAGEQADVFKQKRWEQQLVTITENLKNIKSSAPSTAQAIDTLLADFSANQKGFTTDQLDMVQNILDTLIVETQSQLAKAYQVTIEFTQVDYVKLLKDTQVFKAEMNDKIRRVDVNALSQYANALVPHMNNAKQLLNGASLLDSLTLVKDDFEKQNNGELDDYAIPQLKTAIDQLTANNTNYSNLSYIIRDTIYYMSEDFLQYSPNVSYAPSTLDQKSFLQEQMAGLDADQVVTNVETLDNTINQYNAGQANYADVKYAASDIRYQLDSFNNDNSGTVTPLKTAIKTYLAEESLFSIDRMVEDVDQAIAYLSTNNAQQQRRGASNIIYLDYNIKNYKDMLGQDLVDMYYNVLLPEANKTNQDRVKQNIAQTNQLAMTQEPKEFFNSSYYNINSISSELEKSKASLSVPSQIVVAEFSTFAQAPEAANRLIASMNQVGTNSGSVHFTFNSDQLTQSGVPMNASDAALFISQLCLDYRDRANMIPVKLEWIAGMKVLENKASTDAIDYTKDIWSQVTAADMIPYQQLLVDLQSAVTPGYDEPAKNPLIIGKYAFGFRNGASSVCQTKYIFDEYVRQQRTFDNIEDFNSGYLAAQGKCSTEDQNSFYVFKGAKVLTTTALEAPLMETKKKAMIQACETSTMLSQLYSNAPGFEDADCVNFFKKPYYSRFNTARAAMATGLFYDNFFRDNMDSNEQVAFLSHNKPELGPLTATLGYDGEFVMDRFEQSWIDQAQWNSTDMGFNKFLNLQNNPSELQLEQAIERIRGNLSRSNSGWGSSFGDGLDFQSDGAADPLMKGSNSYSRAEAEAHCDEYDETCDFDGLRRWVYVTKVKMDNNLSPEDIMSGKAVNFENQWFDYDYFNSGAQYFNPNFAWGKVGGVNAEEIDTLLYLINVDGERIYDGGGEYDEEYH